MKRIIISTLFVLIAVNTCYPVASEMPNVSTLALSVSCAPSCDQLIHTLNYVASSAVEFVKKYPYIALGSIVLAGSAFALSQIYKEMERQSAILVIRLKLIEQGFGQEYIQKVTHFLNNNTKTREEIIELLSAYIAALE